MSPAIFDSRRSASVSAGDHERRKSGSGFLFLNNRFKRYVLLFSLSLISECSPSFVCLFSPFGYTIELSRTRERYPSSPPFIFSSNHPCKWPASSRYPWPFLCWTLFAPLLQACEISTAMPALPAFSPTAANCMFRGLSSCQAPACL
ncbi:uncharacterized protein CTRU02_208086 [Colletotrichum truncatum]|uniref:Uncharacterized protein n=1 Tax=Colletotrichum truncatum TaxID=5467 RepID=A0ACC3YVM1_COLTU|nr:uncharacterized protein CTRU02_10915 [Colletotrichum truncatum]KAF6786417.1 hypothetical protein CTRU02_10915 [Colletotrichum truncatum]